MDISTDFCSTTDSVNIDYKPEPIVNLVVPNLDCEQDRPTLFADVSNIDDLIIQDENIIYTWYYNNVVISDSIRDSLVVFKDGNYKVEVSTDFCSNSDSETIDYKAQPIVEIIEPELNCVDAGQVLTAVILNKNDFEAQNETLTLEWKKDGLTIENSNSFELIISESGTYDVIVTASNGCSDIYTVDVSYMPAPIFTLNEYTLCEGETTTLTANVTNPDVDKDELTYTWSNGISGKGNAFKTIDIEIPEDITTTKTYNYSVTVETKLGCSLNQSTNITFNPTPVFELGDDIEMCDIETRTLTVDYEDPNLQVIWNTGETSKSISVKTTGEYWATASLNNCTFSDTIYVETIPFPKFEIDVLGLDCDTKIITLTASTEEENVDFEWSTGETTKTIQVNKGGDYSLIVSKGGCNIAKNIELKNQFFEDLSSLEEIPLCIGDSITLKPNHEYESILWSNGSTLPSITVKEGGHYRATITNKFYCDDILEYEIIIDEGPKITNIEVQNEFVSFNFEGGIAPFQYFVDDNQVYSKNIANNFTEGTHQLYIIDKNGCDCYEDFFVKDPILIIDIVTPNGDGFNDTWTIDDLKKYPNSMVRIYDRYGRLMHKSPGAELNWDGTFNGNMVPANDYWYHIDLFADGSIVYTGHFALIR